MMMTSNQYESRREDESITSGCCLIGFLRVHTVAYNTVIVIPLEPIRSDIAAR
jgi:hypothetical protein